MISQAMLLETLPVEGLAELLDWMAPADLRGAGLVFLRIKTLLQTCPLAREETRLSAPAYARTVSVVDAVVGEQKRLTEAFGPPWREARDPDDPSSDNPYRGEHVSTAPLYSCFVEAASDAQAHNRIAAIYLFGCLRAAELGKIQAWESAIEKAGLAVRRLTKAPNASVLALIAETESIRDLFARAEDIPVTAETAEGLERIADLASFLSLVTGSRSLRRHRGGGGGGGYQYRVDDGGLYWEYMQEGEGQLIVTGHRFDPVAYEKHARLIHPLEAQLGVTYEFVQEDASNAVKQRYASESQRWQQGRRRQLSPHDGIGLPLSDIRRAARVLAYDTGLLTKERAGELLAGLLMLLYGRNKTAISNMRTSTSDRPRVAEIEYLADLQCLRLATPDARFAQTWCAPPNHAHSPGTDLLLPAVAGIPMLVEILAGRGTVPRGQPLFSLDREATLGTDALAVVRQEAGLSEITGASLRRALPYLIVRETTDLALARIITSQNVGTAAQPHYINLESAQLQAIFSRCMHKVEVSCSNAALGARSRIGCEACPTEEFVRQFFARQRELVREARNLPWREAHHRFMGYYWAGLALALGLRSTADPIPERRGDWVIWDEKGANRRVLPIVGLVARLYQRLEEHRRLLARRLGSQALATYLPLVSICPGSEPLSMGPADLTILLPDFSLPANCFRKFVRSALTGRANGEDLDAFMAHWDAGHNPWSPYSSFDPSRLKRLFADQIEPLLLSIGIEDLESPLAGTS